jgi:hypothetical protein
MQQKSEKKKRYIEKIRPSRGAADQRTYLSFKVEVRLLSVLLLLFFFVFLFFFSTGSFALLNCGFSMHTPRKDFVIEELRQQAQDAR